MKKFSLLLCLCIAALMVPQRMWAETVTINESNPTIEVDGSTLTITSTGAGTLSTFMDNVDQSGHVTSEQLNTMGGCAKIVLSGDFNTSDLESIKASGEKFKPTEVDMSDAKFVQAANSNEWAEHYLFHNDANVAVSKNELAYTNVKGLYIWTSTIAWQSVSPAPENESSVALYSNDGTMQAAKSTSTLGSYAAYPNSTNHCLKLSVTDEAWGSMSNVDPGDAIVVSWNENDRNSHLSDYKKGQTIKTIRYYQKVELEEGNKFGWYLCYPSDINQAATDGASVGADMTNLDASKCNIDDYLLFYVYYTKTNGSWGSMSTTTTASTTDAWFLEDQLEAQLNNYQEGQTIKVKRYYQKRAADYAWNLCTTGPTAEQLAGASNVYNGNQLGADMTNLFRSYGEVGAYLSFDVYYTKDETRAWTTPDNTEGAKEANFPYDYRDNHLMDFNNNDVVKMSEYNYYLLQAGGSGSESWQEVAFNDGDKQRITYKVADDAETTDPGELPTTSVSSGQYGVIFKNDRQEKVYSGNEWVVAGSSYPDYSQMSFKHWKTTLVTATTSKYADTSIPNDVFQECKSLTTVNYLAGNVTGFLDHTTGSGYAQNLSVTIGKDVTQIDNSAFQRCDGLTNLTFDTNYDDFVESNGNPKSGCGYPKELTIGDYAFQDCKYLMNVTIPNRVVSIGNSAFEHAGNKTQSNVSDESTGDFILTFERRNRTLDGTVSINFDRNLVIGDNCFDQCYNLKTLSLPIRLSSLGSGAFTDTKNLTSLTIREEETEDARITTIPRDAFLRSGIKSVTIPRSVTEIQSGAFEECFDIETITFQKQSGNTQEPLIIRSGAFAGGTESEYKLKNVNVEISPSERLLVCEYNAFNFTSLVGQTNVGSNQEAVLNFKDEDWDYYQGNWKKGYAFSQSNLNLFKDGVNRTLWDNPTVDNNGLAFTDGAQEPRNGWQQFAVSNTEVDVIIRGNYLRTYSTLQPHYIPKKADTGDYLYDIYRVTNFTDGWNSGQDVNDRSLADEATRTATATKVELTLSEETRLYVPKQTGLLLKTHGNDENYFIYQYYIGSDVTTTMYPHNIDVSASTTANLLYPSCDDTNTREVTEGETTVTKVVINPTIPYPIGDISNSPSNKYRVFGLYTEDNSFWRSEPNVEINQDMAYLKLPTSLFHWANESMGIGNGVPSSARISLVFADDDNEATGVKSITTADHRTDSYYSIQGVGFASPQRSGLYIHNGKKVFVK